MTTCWPLLRQLSILAVAALICLRLIGVVLIVWGVGQMAFFFRELFRGIYWLVCRRR